MKPHESLGHAFGAMARMVDREMRTVFAEYGVQPGQLPVLLALYEHDGQTQAELAASIGVEQPTMASTLGRMEREGFVARRSDRDDGRRVGVFLTAPAKRLEGPLAEAVRGVNRRALRGLSAEERSLLYELPERLRKNLA